MMHKITLILIILYSCGFAQSPHGANFRLECSQCHTSESWQIKGKVSFDHSTTSFPLIGQHISVNCADCHQSLEFTSTKNNCSDCHLDRHQSSVGKDCAKCHNNNSWLVQNATELHQQSRFPLLGRHASASCEQCHTNYASLRFEPLGIQCIDCHRNDYNSATNPDHRLSNFSIDCLECHSITEQSWSGAGFNHSFFPLSGGHQLSNCFACHQQNNFSGLSSNCYACHSSDFNSTTNPNHTLAAFSTNCNECHNINVWSPTSFNHAVTGYTLTGAHENQSCVKCHSGGYQNTPNTCVGCHQTNFNNAVNPNHIAANFPSQCEQCHSTTAWQPASFDHDNLYFPIYSGKHKNKWINCNECHTTPSNYSQFSCINCHEHNRTDMDSEHQGINGYVYESNACLSCHPNGDEDGAVNHINTEFPLSGQHTALSCQSCHTNSQPLSIECLSCHKSDFMNSLNPDHEQIGISDECKLCHTSDGWTPSSFQHSATNYPLLGAHVNANCSDCHRGATTGTTTLCDNCHHEDFIGSQNPDHAEVGISVDCNSCHNSSAWTPSTFEHSATDFPLLGAHVNTNCSDCHRGVTTGTPTVCDDCHHEAFANSLNPNHAAVGISVDCNSCHNSSAWAPSTFEHTSTNFPLLGAHINTSCSDCHQGATTGTTTVCDDCHHAAFTNSQNPNHSVVGISVDCNSCHNSTAWIPSSFQHSATNFQLTGAHINVTCENCHNGVTAGTSNICNDCHDDDYLASANPNHSALSIPITCEDCHTTNANWAPATFSIHNNYYPLIGAHATIASDCATCHNGNYTTTPNLCVDCHISDYNSATNPNHVAGQFPHACESCHSQSAWSPSTFNHDQQWFPIYTGKHRNKWTNCSQCHPNAANYSEFTCISCHEHRKTKMDSEHQGISGYVYLSSACLNCHPDGDSDSHRIKKLYSE